jgi:plastocyanin
MKRLLTYGLALTALSGAAFASTGLVISQQGRVFAPGEVNLAVGAVLRIDNDDQVLHHVYIESPALNFDSGEQPPGKTVEIKFDKAGSFVARCAIHPKMHLTVNVK